MMTGDGPEILCWTLAHPGVAHPVLPRGEGVPVLMALKPSLSNTALFLRLCCTLPRKKNPLVAGLLLLQLAEALPHVSVGRGWLEQGSEGFWEQGYKSWAGWTLLQLDGFF